MRLKIAMLTVALMISVPALAQITPHTRLGAPSAGHQASPPNQTGAPAEGLARQAPPEIAAKVDPAKEAAIRHLMDVTQTAKLGDNLAAYIKNQVQTVMGRTLQGADLQKFMDTFEKRFSASAPSSAVTDAMVPIYDRAFSLEEIQGLLSFYESPLGQHVVKVLPQVTRETQDAGMKLDQAAALQILHGMSGDYPELKRILPPDPGAGPAPGAPPAPAPKPSPAPAQP